MHHMIVYIVGHKGWIGGLFMKCLKEHNVVYSDYRAESSAIKQDIIDKHPTHVLYCAGRTSGGLYKTIDYLEDPSTLRENLNDNLYGPMTMALFCQQQNIHFTYIGTGCIYTYDTEHTPENQKGFTETDAPNFFGSNYSIVKGITDLLLQQTNALSLRIRMPMTNEEHAKSFTTKLVSYKKIHSVLNSMTNLDVMIPIAIMMMENKENGTYNFTNVNATHEELLEAYKRDKNQEHTWELVEGNALDVKAKRSNTLLDTRKLNEYLAIQHMVNASIQKILFP